MYKKIVVGFGHTFCQLDKQTPKDIELYTLPCFHPTTFRIYFEVNLLLEIIARCLLSTWIILLGIQMQAIGIQLIVKKVRQPSRFKLTHHANNQEVGKLLIFATVFPLVNVQPLGYGQVYIIFSSHKCYNVIVGNYPSCLCIYFVIMSTIFLGTCGAWVQCKHLYHILQNIMCCGQIEEFIHYSTWSWDKVQHLLVCVKGCEN